MISIVESRIAPRRRRLLLGRFLMLLSVAQSLAVDLQAQSDDFDDFDDAGWVRYSPLTIVGAPAAFSFPKDASGGGAYRIQCPAPAVFELGPTRGLGYWTNLYTDLYAAVDLAGWDNGLDQVFGILFRAQNIGFATTTGYVFNYNPQQSSGGRGQLQLNRVAGEYGSGTIGFANISLDPARRYRLVLTAVGGDFTARVYDLLDLTLPLAAFTANDLTSASGASGLFTAYLGNAVTDPVAGRADSTYDNYSASAQPFDLVPFPATMHGVRGMPQVVNRSPVSRSTFFDAAKGISFTATTFTTSRIVTNAIRLVLNGIDVSSSLSVSGGATNVNVSFSGLLPNTVYDGRIVLEDLSGRKSTNEWTFDTLTEELLDSASVKIIEVEDYNYGGGKFQDAPPVSGVSATGTLVNGSGVGYYDQVGVPDVDYFDHSQQAGSGLPPEYRSSDSVGTQAGSIESGTSGRENPIQNDTRRRKSAAWDLPEYQVRRTEGGEWMNYTRNFAGGDYHVFLRAGARTPQPVHLDRVTSDPAKPDQMTSRIGSFQVPNTGLMVNYRHVPLSDASGNLAVVKLSGLQTLRLTVGGPQQDATLGTMTLNYLLFVPASPSGSAAVQVESSPSVAGPFTPDLSAVAMGSAEFELAASGATRFYRLRSSNGDPRSYRITSIQTVSGKVTVKFKGQ